MTRPDKHSAANFDLVSGHKLRTSKVRCARCIKRHTNCLLRNLVEQGCQAALCLVCQHMLYCVTHIEEDKE